MKLFLMLLLVTFNQSSARHWALQRCAVQQKTLEDVSRVASLRSRRCLRDLARARAPHGQGLGVLWRMCFGASHRQSSALDWDPEAEFQGRPSLQNGTRPIGSTGA